jgi:type IV secretion system protein VirB9
MKHTARLIVLSLPLLCGPLFAADTPNTAIADSISEARIVEYGEHDIIHLHAKLRYTTLIVLPKNEQILDFTCGDKEFWIVNGSQNFAYVKPAKENSQTNLNLITASGNVYSFMLNEVSGEPAIQPDLKVFVELRDQSMLSAANATPKFVASTELENYRQQIEIARNQARDAQASSERQVARFRSEYPTALKFTYRFERDKKPFMVTAIYHDDKFTYIQASPEETPALYEIKDGKPSLINFQYRNGTYIVDKILDSGYLAIGKARLNFNREE